MRQARVYRAYRCTECVLPRIKRGVTQGLRAPGRGRFRDMMRRMDRLEAIRGRIADAMERIPQERVALAAGVGRFLAVPALAVRAAPPFTCSAMDGYALRAADAT